MKGKGLDKLEAWVVKWDTFLRRLVTPRRLAVFLTVVYLASLIPLLWIAWYNYPSADDYSIGSDCHQIWIQTHNVFAVVWQGVIRSADDWLNWMGYFTSNFLMAVPPSTFGERGYVLTTWIMLGMLSFSTIFLFRVLFVKVFKADKYVAHSIAMLMLFVSVQCMCPAGRVEAFYWYSGAANYIFVHSMSLFFFGLMILAVYDRGKKRAWDLGAASFLGFFTGGGNQMTALNVAIVLLLAALIIGFEKKWAKLKALGIPMAFFYAGFLLNVSAPGNWVRAEGANGMDPIKAVLVSFYECLDLAMSEWTTWPVLVIMAAMLPLFWHMAAGTSFNFPCPVIVVLLGYCLVSAMATPPLFAVGNMAAGRLLALMFLMYILILTLCVGYVIGWVRKKYEMLCMGMEKRAGLAGAGCWCLVCCLAFLAFGSALTVVPEPYYYTFSSAITDLANGDARAYGDVLEGRVERYRSGEKGLIEVESLTAQPALLYFSDIREDPEYWENRGLARFYGLDGVAVKGD